MTTAIARDGETVDVICWRELGRTKAVTEQVYALNPGLAALGTRLPAGTEVVLPANNNLAPSTRDTIQLWS